MAKLILVSLASSSLLILLLIIASGNMLIPKAFGAEPVGTCWNDCSQDPYFMENCAPNCFCVGTSPFTYAGVCYPRN
ncbi:hypothetical protein Leryth_023292 [Lithospermum erythrorhizon]|nr:hypothetical protein Leryth_023292 [Lithospermum erythrorhizon]